MNITTVIKNNHSLVFIGVNIFVAFLGFVRSFAFMKFFDFKELGIVTLVSTAASLIGMFQIGLINGGYRIIALRDSDSNIKVNNVVFSYFGILALLLAAFSVFVYILGFYTNWFILLIINVMGICMLLTNWLTNTLIGASEFKRLNVANSISAFASLLCLLLAYYFGLYGALLSLLIQPILFVSVVFLTDNKEIPTKFDLDFTYIKYILTFGFIPYLSGIFFLLYMQIERWSVNAFLGPEALGKMYLVFLTITLWVLVPTSINSLFFPKSVKLYSDNQLAKLDKLIKKYFLILVFYSVLCSVLMLLFFSPLVKYVFPNHLPYVKLVFIVLPGLILRILCDPIGLLLNSMVKLKPILFSDLVGILFYITTVSILGFTNNFSLENILICYVLYNLIKLIYLICSYLLIKKQLLNNKYDYDVKA
jgi:O-antigen/teichoic acid export membrane protein